jgi:hypothetical protein
MSVIGSIDPGRCTASDAVQRPGSMLPITLIEVRANCHLNGLGCSG